MHKTIVDPDNLYESRVNSLLSSFKAKVYEDLTGIHLNSLTYLCGVLKYQVDLALVTYLLLWGMTSFE